MGLFARGSWPDVAHGEIVKRARILVIDDSDFPYLPLFRRDGYTVTKWNNVRDLTQLENGDFDVILLDLYGVGTSLSADQGLGVLEHLRKVNPTQLVIAYSNAEWSLQYQPFFEQADTVLHKTGADYVTFKRAVDELLEQRFSLGFYVERALGQVPDLAGDERLRRRLTKALRTRNTTGLRSHLESRIEDTVTVDRVLQVIQIGIGAAQIWTH